MVAAKNIENGESRCNFTHLHVHTIYSLLDGMNRIDKAVEKVKNMGHTALAITDHGSLGGIPVFQEECFKQGIKPLLGMEGYYTPDITEAAKPIEQRKEDATKAAIAAGALKESDIKNMKKKDISEAIEPYMYDMHQYHILYIAKSLKGWRNLVKLSSESARLCTYNGRALVDTNLLRKYHEDIICTNACIGSYSSHCVQNGDYDKAEAYILEMKEIFGDDFYLEIQPLNIEEQWQTNMFYLEMHQKYGIKAVATNDAHYTNKEDWDDHDTLLCIGTKKLKKDADRMKYSNDFWLRSEEEMKDAFLAQTQGIMENYEVPKEHLEAYYNFCLEAIENTAEVADKVEEKYNLGSDTQLFPKVYVPNGLTAEQYLNKIAYQGLYKYLSEHPECDVQTYEKRLKEELDIINPKGFAAYMLTVREYVQWANENGCATGPGRGSACGSLCLFATGITKNIDPIEHQLLFSRFLTADRKDPPDVDLDFSYSMRGDVIAHLEDYYGADHVAHIGTFGTMKVKNGVKDVARVLDIPFLESNQITKTIDGISTDPNLSFKMLDDMKDGDENEKAAWKAFNELEKKYPEVFRLARYYEGIPRQFGVHASGVLVTPIPVTDIFPVRIDQKTGVSVCMWTGPQVEHYGSVKLDILGLKTLDVIQKTLSFIPEIENIDDLYTKVDTTDKNVLKFISEKNTDGTFQLESNLVKGIIDMIKPTTFDDVGAINALCRPGPLSANMPQSYGKRKNKEEDITYPIRGCEDILDNTFGVIPYQEQLMQISKKVSGFNDMQADSITRKIIAKKKAKLFPMLERCHIYGKKNCEGPEGWEENDNLPWYDPEGKYGDEIPGAVANGYTVEEMKKYFETIAGFSSYCFNKSHSAAYAYIGFLTAWLKYYYPVQFMAAVLTMADDDKKSYYVDICRKMGIKITVPDVNISGRDFTPDPENNQILYGLSSIKSVGEASIGPILENAPYKSLEDMMERLPKKAFNKRVGEALIKCGALDSFDGNRIYLLNKLHELRGDKEKNPETGKNEIVSEPVTNYNEQRCIEFEDETLGTHITCRTWWETVETDEKVTFTAEIGNMREHRDKKGKLMCFVDLVLEDSTKVSAIVFASKYKTLNSLFYNRKGKQITVSGKKADNGELLIDDASPAAPAQAAA